MKITKRALSLITAIVVFCSMLSITAFAESENEITVHFSLLGDDAHTESGVHTDYEYWISYEEYSLPENSTALDLFKYAMDDYGFKYENSNGYVSSITDIAGVKLAEMTNGPRSGWMYSINGKFTDAMDKVTLNDGDRMLFFYTDDYNTIDWNGTSDSVEDVIKLIDSIGEVTSDSKAKIDEAQSAYNKLSDDEKLLVENYIVLEDAKYEYEVLNENNQRNIQLNEAIDKTAEYLINNSSFDVGSIGGDWSVFGLARADKLDEAHKAKYAANVENALKKAGSGTLNSNKATENSRVVLALTAAGFDASDFAGYDLTTPLCDYDFVVKQGVNGAVFALLALDSADYNADNTQIRDKYIDYIISQQMENGGYSYDGQTVDVDLTAMSMQALAKYTNDEEVMVSVVKSIAILYELQTENGGFEAYGSECSESSAQALTAILEFAGNCTGSSDDDIVAEQPETLAAIMEYYNEDGGFGHDNTEVNMLATEQCFYALTAYKRYIAGKTSLYDMSDVELTVYKSGQSGELTDDGENESSSDDNSDGDKTYLSGDKTTANTDNEESGNDVKTQYSGSDDNPDTGAVGSMSVVFSAMAAAAAAFTARKKKSH